MKIIFDDNGKIIDLLQNDVSLKGCKYDIVQVDIPELDNLSDEQLIEAKETYINQNLDVLESNDRLKNALISKRYSEINKKTQELIYAGIDYTYNSETIHFNFDIYNQLEFTAVRIKADTDELTYPYRIWEGNYSFNFENKSDLVAFLNTVFNFIQDKKDEGKELRDSLLDKTLQELIEFEDTRG